MEGQRDYDSNATGQHGSMGFAQTTEHSIERRPPAELRRSEQAGRDTYQEGGASGINDSMDFQLHPLADSTWGEIFPIITYFQEIFNMNSDKAGERHSTKAQEFLKQEAAMRDN